MYGEVRYLIQGLSAGDVSGGGNDEFCELGEHASQIKFLFECCEIVRPKSIQFGTHVHTNFFQCCVCRLCDRW